jgi:hypothetical protein
MYLYAEVYCQNFEKNAFGSLFYARNRLRALPNRENASFTLIQGEHECIEEKIA